jgi:hypothetical protein
MTVVEMARVIGRLADWCGARGASRNGGFVVTVKVVDARSQFGRTDYLISPVNGSGEMWVSVDSVILHSVAADYERDAASSHTNPYIHALDEMVSAPARRRAYR